MEELTALGNEAEALREKVKARMKVSQMAAAEAVTAKSAGEHGHGDPWSSANDTRQTGYTASTPHQQRTTAATGPTQRKQTGTSQQPDGPVKYSARQRTAASEKTRKSGLPSNTSKQRNANGKTCSQLPVIPPLKQTKKTQNHSASHGDQSFTSVDHSFSLRSERDHIPGLSKRSNDSFWKGLHRNGMASPRCNGAVVPGSSGARVLNGPAIKRSNIRSGAATPLDVQKGRDEFHQNLGDQTCYGHDDSEFYQIPNDIVHQPAPQQSVGAFYSERWSKSIFANQERAFQHYPNRDKLPQMVNVAQELYESPKRLYPTQPPHVGLAEKHGHYSQNPYHERIREMSTILNRINNDLEEDINLSKKHPIVFKKTEEQNRRTLADSAERNNNVTPRNTARAHGPRLTSKPLSSSSPALHTRSAMVING